MIIIILLLFNGINGIENNINSIDINDNVCNNV